MEKKLLVVCAVFLIQILSIQPCFATESWWGNALQYMQSFLPFSQTTAAVDSSISQTVEAINERTVVPTFAIEDHSDMSFLVLSQVYGQVSKGNDLDAISQTRHRLFDLLEELKTIQKALTLQPVQIKKIECLSQKILEVFDQVCNLEYKQLFKLFNSSLLSLDAFLDGMMDLARTSDRLPQLQDEIMSAASIGELATNKFVCKVYPELAAHLSKNSKAREFLQRATLTKPWISYPWVIEGLMRESIWNENLLPRSKAVWKDVPHQVRHLSWTRSLWKSLIFQSDRTASAEDRPLNLFIEDPLFYLETSKHKQSVIQEEWLSKVVTHLNYERDQTYAFEVANRLALAYRKNRQIDEYFKQIFDSEYNRFSWEQKIILAAQLSAQRSVEDTEGWSQFRNLLTLNERKLSTEVANQEVSQSLPDDDSQLFLVTLAAMNPELGTVQHQVEWILDRLRNYNFLERTHFLVFDILNSFEIKAKPFQLLNAIWTSLAYSGINSEIQNMILNSIETTRQPELFGSVYTAMARNARTSSALQLRLLGLIRKYSTLDQKVKALTYLSDNQIGFSHEVFEELKKVVNTLEMARDQIAPRVMLYIFPENDGFDVVRE